MIDVKMFAFGIQRIIFMRNFRKVTSENIFCFDPSLHLISLMKTFKKAEERRRSYLGEQLIIGRNDFPLSLSLSLEIVFREKSKLQ